MMSMPRTTRPTLASCKMVKWFKRSLIVAEPRRVGDS
jgi:hypothetical protein